MVAMILKFNSFSFHLFLNNTIDVHLNKYCDNDFNTMTSYNFHGRVSCLEIFKFDITKNIPLNVIRNISTRTAVSA